MAGISLSSFKIGVVCLGIFLLGSVMEKSGPFAPTSTKTEIPASEQLGHVSFPNSCKAEAQPALLKGLALLHSFQYSESEAAFKAALDLDANCAMAQWGKAMALYHQLWDFPRRHKRTTR
jgi:hypothetical protein